MGFAPKSKTLLQKLEDMMNQFSQKNIGQVLSELVIVLIFAMVLMTIGCETIPDRATGASQVEISKKEQQQRRFVAMTPEDVAVELVGVCERSLKDCWRPDGSKLDEKIYLRAKRVLHQKDEYGFILKVEGPNNINFRFYDIKGAINWDDSADVVNCQGHKLDGFQAINAHIDDGRSYTSLRLGIAAGPWHTIAECNAAEQNSQSNADIVFSNVRESDNDVSIFVSDKSYGNFAYSILAIDKDGNTHTGHIEPPASHIRPNQMKVKFYNLKLAQIDKFRFQKRPYRVIEFRDISLRPGVRRNVEIEIERHSGDKAATSAEKSDTGKTLVESTIKFIDQQTIKEQMLKVPFPAGTRLVLDDFNGSVTVNGSKENECKVSVSIEVGLEDDDKAKELLEKVAILPELSNGKVAIRIIQPVEIQQSPVAKFDFEITLPQKADLEINTNKGSITIVDVTGEIDCKTNNGEILAQKVNGNVRLRNNYGKIIIKNANFDRAAIRANIADVNCEDISGNINIRVASGQVNVRYAKTAPNVCDAGIITTDGDIDFTGPVDFSATVEARTMKGQIETDFPLKVEGEMRKTAYGTIGKGRGKLNLKCTIGSIRIHENLR